MAATRWAVRRPYPPVTRPSMRSCCASRRTSDTSLKQVISYSSILLYPLPVYSFFCLIYRPTASPTSPDRVGHVPTSFCHPAHTLQPDTHPRRQGWVSEEWGCCRWGRESLQPCVRPTFGPLWGMSRYNCVCMCRGCTLYVYVVTIHTYMFISTVMIYRAKLYIYGLITAYSTLKLRVHITHIHVHVI